jgi:hypothetical protein
MVVWWCGVATPPSCLDNFVAGVFTTIALGYLPLVLNPWEARRAFSFSSWRVARPVHARF